MKRTFKSQRCDIKNNTLISEMKFKWPFLFEKFKWPFLTLYVLPLLQCKAYVLVGVWYRYDHFNDMPGLAKVFEFLELVLA